MLSKEILTALSQYTANIQQSVALVLQTGEHQKREELREFLTDVASTNENIVLVEKDTGLKSPISFTIEVDQEPTGIEFSGIPSGHEFNSLVLALLHATGTPTKLDDSIKSLLAQVDEPLHFEVFVSLSCHNCPDVVQALNQFALQNPKIRAEMIDGGLFQEEIAERDIQGVPTVYLNGELFANGKVDAAQLVEKLLARYPHLTATNSTPALPLQDVTVVGGGPAGIASAIYSARKGLKVTLIADRIGGQVKDTLGIENLIGTPKTTGPELAGNLMQHLNDYAVTVKEHLKVNQIEKGEIKTLHLSSGEVIHTKTLIIATGAKWRELGIPGEKENIGNGVAYCPHCDGPFFKGKDVAVIGGGNSGIEAALDLAGIVKSVTVFEFMPELKADKVLVEKAEAKNNITLLRNVATQEITAANGKVNALVYQDRATGKTHTQPLAGVFVQIGLVPNSAFLGDLVEKTRFGEIVIDPRGQTSEPGIYACGDVTTVPYKQIVVAMGEGAKAALAAFDYLIKEGDRLDALYAELGEPGLAEAS